MSATETQTNPLWENNLIQFARLLSEIQAGGCLGEADWDTLLQEMDLESDDLLELFDRADVVWQKSKALTPQRELDEDEFECQGHPAGPYDPAGLDVYCDGTCRLRYVIRSAFKDPHDGWLYWSNVDGWVDFKSATIFTQEERNIDPFLMPEESGGWVEIRKGKS